MGKRMGGGGHDQDVGGHGDRPWVYFMIDCFLLITNFFIITFKFKAEECVLPQRMPPGGTVASKSAFQETKKILNVHVTHPDGSNTAVYQYMSKEVPLAELAGVLASISNGGDEVQVRVSYEGNVPWGDVMAVFNSCAKAKIRECGLVPCRSAI